MILFRGPLIRQYVIVITVNLSLLPVGLNLAWSSPVLVKLTNANQTVLEENLNEHQVSWIASTSTLASVLVFFLPAFVVDKIGVKYTIIGALFPHIMASFLFIFANKLWMILVGRMINGASGTFIMSMVNVYASEIASKEARGSLGTILQISCSIGILIMLSMGPYLDYITLNIVMACLVTLVLIPILFLPDSPYFLYSKGRSEEALKILTYLRGSKAAAKEEIKEYSLTENTSVNKCSLLQNRIFIKTVFIVVIFMIGCQLVGFNAIQFYLQTILESTKTNVKSEIASVIIGCIQIVSSLFTTLISDRFGRKPIFVVSITGLAIGLLGLGAFFKVQELDQPITGAMNFLPLVSLIVVVFCYSAGPGSLMMAVASELFEGPNRAVGVSCGFFGTSTAVFLLAKYFPAITSLLGASTTYWILAGNCVLLCVFIVFCIPETKGKSFAEIQVALGKSTVKGDREMDEAKKTEERP